jgi:DNA-binding NarL/FixJ family response regulator
MNEIPLVYNDTQHEQQQIKPGVIGDVSKETAGNGFLHSLRKGRKGTAPFNAPASKRRGKESPPGRRTNGQPATLSSRQTEIIRLIADGYGTRNIAELLRISPKTVEKHRQALMKKLDIHCVAMLTRYAVSSGIVASNPAPHKVFVGISRTIPMRNRSKQRQGRV